MSTLIEQLATSLRPAIPRTIVALHDYNARTGDVSREQMLHIRFEWSKTLASLVIAWSKPR